MAVRIVVRSAASAGPEPSITVDAPRLVIGRGDGCELRLPDPSVSARHASLRQRGAEYLLVDEGSSNGTFLGPVRLPPHTPRAVRHGDLVRVGRVWLEIRFEAALVKGSAAAAAKELALELVTRGLSAQGEDPRPRVEVVDGPDLGAQLPLADAGRRYVIGRAAEADLVLRDPAASFRHVEIGRRGEALVVRDLGARGGSSLDGAPLGPSDTAWKPGQTLAIGKNRFAYSYPAAEALAELERSSDERMEPGDAPPMPGEETPARASDDDAASTTPAAPPAQEPTPTPGPIAEALAPRPKPRAGADAGWNLVDAVVVLLALGVLALSGVGAWWLFR